MVSRTALPPARAAVRQVDPIVPILMSLGKAFRETWGRLISRAAIIDTWASLSEAIRVGIVAMLRAAKA
jgi:hypothetical protein